MLISLLIFILFSNAITIRRDKSILQCRIVILSLIITSILSYNNFYIKALEEGISLYGRLLRLTILSQTFSILLISTLSLILTSILSYNNLVKPHNIMINSSLSTSISTLTLLLLLFTYTPEEWFSRVDVSTLYMKI